MGPPGVLRRDASVVARGVESRGKGREVISNHRLHSARALHNYQLLTDNNFQLYLEAMDPLAESIELVGLQAIAKACGVSYQAVSKWVRAGLPRTEWTGETSYASNIERLTEGRVPADALLAWSREQRSRAVA